MISNLAPCGSAATAKRAQERTGIRIRGQTIKRLEQHRLELGSAGTDGRARVLERVAGDLRKIRMPRHQRPQPRVLYLPGPPHLEQPGRSIPETGGNGRNGAIEIEQGAVRIEDACLDGGRI